MAGEVTEPMMIDYLEETLAAWATDYTYFGDRQYRVVNITPPDGDDMVFEVRDHNNGQAIVGKFKIEVAVTRVG